VIRFYKRLLKLLSWFGLRDRINTRDPQLVMWYAHSVAPVAVALPQEYHLRSYSEGGQQLWMDLFNANGQLGRWDAERVERELSGPLQREGQFFVFSGDDIVACAGVYDRLRNQEACWEIGWIAVHPQHAGRRLGYIVTAVAVAKAIEWEKRPIYLLTDDFRLPALKTYLKLGFTPDMGHASYAKRWRRIFAELGRAYESFNSSG
jgi:mycothiol synthase